MDFGIKGKVAIVTGASRGIGKAAALELAKEGANVVVTGIDEYVEHAKVETRGKNIKTGELEAVLREIQGLGVKSIAIKADFTKRAEVENVVARAVAEFGRIDICANVAGGGFPEPFEDVTEASWNLHQEINLLAPWYMCKAIIPIMKKQGWGRIINISSIEAVMCSANSTSYATAKGGLVVFTKTLAEEYGKYGITANNILPGGTLTPHLQVHQGANAKKLGIPLEKHLASLAAAFPTGRFNTPEDIAYLICFLASDKASQITGQSIAVSR